MLIEKCIKEKGRKQIVKRSMNSNSTTAGTLFASTPPPPPTWAPNLTTIAQQSTSATPCTIRFSYVCWLPNAAQLSATNFSMYCCCCLLVVAEVGCESNFLCWIFLKKVNKKVQKIKIINKWKQKCLGTSTNVFFANKFHISSYSLQQQELNFQNQQQKGNVTHITTMYIHMYM